MGMKNLPLIIRGEFEGGDNGNFVGSEAIRILNILKSLGIESIQDECNRVLNEHRERWAVRPPDDNADELGFLITYRNALRELERPFVLSASDSILVEVKNSRSTRNAQTGASAVFINRNTRNPLIWIYLPTLEIRDSMIIWTGFRDTFDTLILHEFLHTCGEPSPEGGVPDSIIRLNHIGEIAIRNLRGKV
jgi:hypothetical protein